MIVWPLFTIFCVGVVIYFGVGLVTKGGAVGLAILMSMLLVTTVIVLAAVAIFMNHAP